ncbi:DNA alkylation repair protein [Marinomonas atlantica]|uniref:DNA alkylation repair protein n=1 Tax=Marinomonas atlantica TaxID=1806668 RepID=UPI00082E361C|nr:DNA alkylation repair protein [Marinomonas atlantica]
MYCYTEPQLPKASKSIEKGIPLKRLLNEECIHYMARNIQLVSPDLDVEMFCQVATENLEELALMQRANHIAKALRACLPPSYEEALEVLVRSFTPESTANSDNGLAVFFYLPHSAFIAEYGLEPQVGEADPFDLSMDAQYELTKRFTAEFSIRPFLLRYPERTLNTIQNWLTDPNDHVRRLCSEGTRPRLPWGKRLAEFGKKPEQIRFILETLKNDPSLYVQRSVANHLGDIAKDNPQWVMTICETWGEDADERLRWLIRHALRYLDKKHYPGANELRRRMK